MIIRSKAPLRLGLAGGGSDVAPYCDWYGGCILNATINLYAHCTIIERKDGIIRIEASDLEQVVEYQTSNQLPLDNRLDLHKGVYNRIISDFFPGATLSFTLLTYSDAPPGSGLGSSSTMVVAIIKAFAEWLNIPLGEYDIAHLAYDIERNDLGLSGGKQDQYAATFGGVNFMEFFKDDRTIVNPLRVKQWIIDELEESLILYYLGVSRSSAQIIDEQKKNTSSGNQIAIEAMHRIKQSAIEMKEAILKGDIDALARIMGAAWKDKKKMATAISNPLIENIFNIALNAGAMTGKISGAGGGGFIFFVAKPEKKMAVIKKLKATKGQVVDFHFTKGGCHGWKII